MENKICYMCGEKATTREHIPPISIFPEKKDFDGTDYRKNLITVPSCELHNLKKSKDDEFLMASLAGVVGNNVIGFWQTKTKIARAFNRNLNLERAVIKDPIEFKVKTENGKVFPLQYIKANTQRIIKCFEQISYGLYFHEFNKIFKGTCVVMPAFLDFENDNLMAIRQILRKKEETDALNWEKKGENTDVFYYQSSPLDNMGFRTLILTFYKGTKVYIALKEDTIPESFNLLQKLFEGGFPITVEFPDGNNFELNKK